MKITREVKIALISILVIVAIASYIIKSYSNRGIESQSEELTPIGQESVDQYNKRKREEALQNEERKKLKDNANDIKSNGQEQLTMNGRDPATGDIIDPINLWSNYATRTYAGKVRHGEKVMLVKRDGVGVLVETKSGLKGWVTYLFIEEYRNESNE